MLTGLPCRTLAQARTATGQLRSRMPAKGPRALLVTSLRVEDTPDDAIDMLAVGDDGAHRLRTPRLDIAANGAGDAIAALFLFHLLTTGRAAAAMQAAGSAIHGVLARSLAAGSRELLIVAAQDQFVAPDTLFLSRPC